MSGRGKGNDEFKRYRDVAPESVDDSTLRQIISENKGNHENIAAALDRLWSDVGNVPDWTVNSKSKKNQDNSAQTKQQPKFDKSRGSGKSRDRGARPAQSTPPPTAAPTSNPKPASTNTKYVNPNPKPASESWPKSSSVVAPSVPAWGSGSLADKIKKKEEEERQAALAAEAAAASAAALSQVGNEESAKSEHADTPEPAAQTDGVTTTKSSGRSRKPRSRGQKTPEVENASPAVPEVEPAVTQPEVPVASPEPVHVPEPEPVAVPQSHPEVLPTEPEPISHVEVLSEPSTQNDAPSNIPAPFLKLGRWESSSENVSGDLQFGSFGSTFKDESVAPSQPNWAADTTVDTRSIDANWASGQGSSSIGGPLNSYFPQATAPPPGLDSQVNKVTPQVGRGTTNNQGRPKTDTVQALPQHSQYYQGQPPGILNPAGRGIPAAAQYPQYHGFDMQTPFMHPGFPPVAGQSPSAIGTTPASAVPTSSSAASTVPAQSQPAQQQVQQPQAQQFNAPPGMGYYFSPYFPGQYYYGQQAAASYYPQGRGVYPNRGPYPTEGYGPGAPMGYPDMYQQGQFGDASSGYGNVPIHPAMPLTGQSAGAPASTIGATGGKAGKTGTGAVGSGQQMSATAGQDAAAAAQHAAYYPYRNDQWQYQGAGQQWGGMPFPAPGTGLQPNTVNAAFNPAGTVGAVGGQAQPQAGSTNSSNQRTGGSTGNTYGASGTFASGGRNTGGATTTW